MEVEERSWPRYIPGVSQSSLPPIGALSMERRPDPETRQQPRYPPLSESHVPPSQLPSPSSTSQPASYSYSTSANTGPTTGYISPPDSRRPTEDKSDLSAPRQSLPSIHEALSSNPVPYSATPQSATPLLEQSAAPSSAPTSAAPAPRSYLGGPQGPPNPFAQPAAPATPRDQALPPPPNPLPPSQSIEAPRSASFSSINGSESRPKPIQTYGLPRSPRTATSSTFATSANRSPVVGNGFNSATTTSPTAYSGPFRSPFPHTSHSSQPSRTLAGPEDESRQFSSNWKLNDPPKYPSSVASTQGHTESVKRTLDIYESEMAFNDILDSSGRLLDFSRHFATRLHQNQRSELTLDTLPNLPEVDEMLRQAQYLHAGLDRVRSSIIYQQQALADERNRAAFHNKLYQQEEMNGYSDEFKGNFTAGDAKKRRGKAAPPGRCHSCNRAETPEWRRGPDGARTLCNACGLHYAKLTRKNGASKGNAIGSSNLRPKHDMQ